MRRTIQAVLAAQCLSLFFLISGAVPAQGAPSSTVEIEERKDRLGDIDARIDVNRRMAEEIRADMEKTRAEYEARKKEHAELAGQLSSNQRSAAEIIDQKARAARELKIATDNLLRKKNLFSDRIRAIYKGSFRKRASLVATSRTMIDFYVNLVYLSHMIRSDSEFISDITRRIKEIRERREELNRKSAELARVDESGKSHEKSLRAATERMNETLSRLHQKSKLLEAQAGDLSGERARIEGEILELEKSLAARPPEVAKPAAPQTPPAEKKPEIDPASITFSWPVRSGKNVLSFFGTQKDPKYNINYFNPGIDIAGGPGEEVLAAAAGQVKYKGEMKSVGKILIIDHGGGMTTLYSHLGGIDVGMGQKVSAGEAIGTLSRQPSAQGGQPFLHFEIRSGGNARDPMDYL